MIPCFLFTVQRYGNLQRYEILPHGYFAYHIYGIRQKKDGTHFCHRYDYVLINVCRQRCFEMEENSSITLSGLPQCKGDKINMDSSAMINVGKS